MGNVISRVNQVHIVFTQTIMTETYNQVTEKHGVLTTEHLRKDVVIKDERTMNILKLMAKNGTTLFETKGWDKLYGGE